MGGICSYDGAAVEAAELRFREGLWRSAPLDAVHEAEVRHRRFGPVLATLFGDLPRAAAVNLVQGAAEAGAVEQGHLAAAVEWMRSREVEHHVSVAGGRPGSGRAEAWLADRGYEPGAPVRRFAHPGMEPVPEDPGPLEVAELGPHDTEGMGHILSAGLDLPGMATILMLGLPAQEGWRCWRASLGGLEVACGSMLVAGRVALLGLEATTPSARRHGCQTALLERRLVEARRAGCDTVVAEACESLPGGEAAARNLLRMGFEEIPGKVTWRRPRGLG